MGELVLQSLVVEIDQSCGVVATAGSRSHRSTTLQRGFENEIVVKCVTQSFPFSHVCNNQPTQLLRTGKLGKQGKRPKTMQDIVFGVSGGLWVAQFQLCH